MSYFSDVACVFIPKGFEQFREVYCRKLDELWENYYDKDIISADYGLKRPPQNFCYVR